MVCYIVPLAATLLTKAGRTALHDEGQKGLWLNIMLLGGAIFGGIDHLWNGQFFALGANVASDLALGSVITASIFACWGVMSFRDNIAASTANVFGKLGITRRPFK